MPTAFLQTDFTWNYEKLYDLFIVADGLNLTAGVGERTLLRATDEENPLSGGIALLIEEGCLMLRSASVSPLSI